MTSSAACRTKTLSSANAVRTPCRTGGKSSTRSSSARCVASSLSALVLSAALPPAPKRVDGEELL
eukprot:CAMPEP_0175078724 /NCGR_PEP_ID=MMETSP0052_2-20121109/24328_1 /TAXON_ID=51329 ORGANISM="Polytomella parva, Strain SAG 63-3" /NCGR_SAMPLE_ID=MMETSP0052_2 /ASSEMBLY_ACC=CAM_ASM_000194 /LENGTH=64 /DNA_ID=CAMNT_0016348779 /DNA_START=58 /DNA_END=249 /DNA_ORIENTATION=+